MAGTVHQLLEAAVVHSETLVRQQLLGHLVWEAVGVVEAEGVLGRDLARALLPGALDDAGQDPLALLEGAPEVLLLRARPAMDRGRLGAELRVHVPHPLHHAVAELCDERPLDLEHLALADRAPQDPAQHVAAVLVRGHHPVGHQEGGGAAVIGQHAQRPGGREVLPVAAARELLAELDQRAEVRGLEDRRHVLEDRRHPVDAQPGVDVLLRQLGERPVLVQLVLHEHEVPELEVALAVVARPLALVAELGAAVEVELRARPAGPGRPRLPEVVLGAELHDPLVRHADRAPALDRLLVRPEPELLVAPEHGDPDALGLEARSPAWTAPTRTPRRPA